MIDYKKEIAFFLTNFFLVEVAGRLTVLAFIWIMRFFGMPQPYVFYYSHPIIPKIIFTILLVVVMIVSMVRILRKKKD